MKLPVGLLQRAGPLPVVLGFTDGLLTALTLAAGRLTTAEQGVTAGLALRIAAGALASGAFVFFVARYAQLRGELIRAERQLNLTSHGRLAASTLGMVVLREGLFSAFISSVASFLGALVPLLVAAGFPHYRWVSIVAAETTLALLGGGLAHSLHGRPFSWAVGLVLGGGALSLIGAYLRIV